MVFVRAFPFEWSLGRCVSRTSVNSKRPIDNLDVENASRWFGECKAIKENYEKWRESEVNIPFTRYLYAVCVDQAEAYLVHNNNKEKHDMMKISRMWPMRCGAGTYLPCIIHGQSTHTTWQRARSYEQQWASSMRQYRCDSAWRYRVKDF